MIVGASVPTHSLVSTGVNDGAGYGGGFYWAGGGAETHDNEQGAGFTFWSSYFGFQLICGANPCRSGVSQLDVGEADLYVQETVGPTLVSPDGLWQSSGWIRGDWNLHFWGDSPSGLCALGATINGQSVASASLRAEPGRLASVQRSGDLADDPHMAVRHWRDAAHTGRLGRGWRSRELHQVDLHR